MLAFAAPVAFAQDPEPEAPLAAFFTSMAKVLPIAILMGLVSSLLGYLRNTPPENFELDKFLATAIIGVMIGILTLGFGWDYKTAQEWLAKRSHHIIHLLDRQDNCNKNRPDQTSAATAHTTNIAQPDW